MSPRVHARLHTPSAHGRGGMEEAGASRRGSRGKTRPGRLMHFRGHARFCPPLSVARCFKAPGHPRQRRIKRSPPLMAGGTFKILPIRPMKGREHCVRSTRCGFVQHGAERPAPGTAAGDRTASLPREWLCRRGALCAASSGVNSPGRVKPRGLRDAPARKGRGAVGHFRLSRWGHWVTPFQGAAGRRDGVPRGVAPG